MPKDFIAVVICCSKNIVSWNFENPLISQTQIHQKRLVAFLCKMEHKRRIKKYQVSNTIVSGEDSKLKSKLLNILKRSDQHRRKVLILQGVQSLVTNALLVASLFLHWKRQLHQKIIMSYVYLTHMRLQNLNLSLKKLILVDWQLVQSCFQSSKGINHLAWFWCVR